MYTCVTGVLWGVDLLVSRGNPVKYPGKKFFQGNLTTLRTHIQRQGGEHYLRYCAGCEKASIAPNSRCAPVGDDQSFGTRSTQSSIESFAIPVVKVPTWSREGLLSHICELVVSDDQVSIIIR
jgi:hypothetical protein